ncbi:MULTISPECIES: type I restriction enzyme HsdR N-terminal domain-containing protein [Clostridium]|uniref:type I restriction enzyme HsdR N-terminal domain-containing protein n=1 Tax=Clostridium TaxID=1485 RepID=UPI0028FD1D95|nr:MULTISPECIES: type I restriction enzyme HsdR N-terminal domain-containing protein [Clostridium]MDU0323631.1 type I restriction enzyme HsdR N-terminal domain-containing protein [Clostridium butyricum]MDU1071617.1 type I restriction enzyme HsdR N-terminal domain-containing protein [Clostridium sp.]MDU2679909.1 type I restriction enzyme HsdR N-terminal domain-containing protein [Clostridium sp.]MDU3584129.1 type I restriction enzyme HsdR N-terminal domain-containing protein [Clostridium butyric
MEVESEANIYQQVRLYLLRLGYSELQLIRNVKLNEKQDIDLVIYDNNKPLIIVEFKNNLKFLNKNNSEIKYNPFIRRLQSYARDTGAEYYILTDGKNNFWFKTDDCGRPQLLNEPIMAGQSSQKDNFGTETIIKLFRELKKYSLVMELELI